MRFPLYASPLEMQIQALALRTQLASQTLDLRGAP